MRWLRTLRYPTWHSVVWLMICIWKRRQWVFIGLLGLCMLSLLSTQSFFLFEMLVSIAPHLMSALLLLLIALMLARFWIAAAGTMLTILFTAAQVFAPKGATSEKGDDVRLVHANVLATNTRYEDMARTLVATHADIIAISEFHDAWAANLTPYLAATYPYHVLLPQADVAGAALFSKWPISAYSNVTIEEKPNILATVQRKEQELRLAILHPATPTSAAGLKSRNNHLLRLAELADDADFVLGDFNVVPWSAWFRRMVETLKMRDARTSYQATYPAWLGDLGIPIDFILYGARVKCKGQKVLSLPGSDHRGLNATFSLSAKPASSLHQQN